MNLKKEKGIITRSLVVTDSFKNIHPKKIAEQSIIIREMPKSIEFKASFWIIGDILVLFSGKYQFIVAVKHRLITQSMKSIFDFLWNVSKEN